MIFGSDQFGLMTYYAFKNNSSKNFKVSGFIDLDVKGRKHTLEGLNVFDLTEVTSAFLKDKSIEEIVIAIQEIDTVRLIEIVLQLLNLDISLKIIPPAEQFADGFIRIDQIKDLTIEDLLLRQPKIDLTPALLDEYQNQVILITGAAGSIGSELARELAQFNYEQLILMDNAESALYDVQQELIKKEVKNFEVVVADIREYDRMDQLFDQYKPKVVFHAAAYKHVPLLEDHPYEAVNVNIVGTKNMADLSVKHSVDKFILISTDKAVNPTNVMGASKRIAELYLNCLKKRGQTKFIATRFGNVLASSGSVIPLFKKQIETGGPVTVTHRDIERYFMTIAEACHLILEAGSTGLGDEIFVFDMGKPIKIYDLAILMIKLQGLRFPEDIDIKIIGLRPGEKVVEELMASDEQSKSTYHVKIRVAQTKPLEVKSLEAKILELCNKAKKIPNLELVAQIKAIVPEYRSNNSKFEVLDDENP